MLGSGLGKVVRVQQGLIGLGHAEYIGLSFEEAARIGLGPVLKLRPGSSHCMP